MAIKDGVRPLINLVWESFRNSNELEFNKLIIEFFLFDLINVKYGMNRMNDINDNIIIVRGSNENSVMSNEEKISVIIQDLIFNGHLKLWRFLVYD